MPGVSLPAGFFRGVLLARVSSGWRRFRQGKWVGCNCGGGRAVEAHLVRYVVSWCLFGVWGLRMIGGFLACKVTPVGPRDHHKIGPGFILWYKFVGWDLLSSVYGQSLFLGVFSGGSGKRFIYLVSGGSTAGPSSSPGILGDRTWELFKDG